MAYCFFAVMVAYQPDGIFQHRHHAQPEQIKLSLADHHAVGMLAQMPRQILQALAQIKIFVDARVHQVQPGIGGVAIQRIVPARATPIRRRTMTNGSASQYQSPKLFLLRAPPAVRDRYRRWEPFK